MNNNNKTFKIISGVFLIAIVFLAIYFNFIKKDDGQPNVKPVATTTNQTAVSNVYKNSNYGFSLTLPDSWKGYTIVNDEWNGYADSVNISEQNAAQVGPLIFIRHPKWTEDVQRQDIPIMVFTLDQWEKIQNDEFHIGAAPINPSELGRNSKYVFALPARYNFAFPVGYEEVDQILELKPLKAF